MADKEKESALKKAEDALDRIQHFEAKSLAREQELGSALNFSDAEKPAGAVLDLFRQLPKQALKDFPASKLNEIHSQANGFFNQLEGILKFDPKVADAYNVRNSAIDNLRNQYEHYFNFLSPFIAYASSRQRDFGALEREARASIQTVADHAADITHELETQREEAARILADVRRVAAEHGVSQQAVYFQQESDLHEQQAESWKLITIWTAVGLGVFAAGSVFLHKWSVLAPTDTYTSIQLGLSKALVFVVIAYVLLLSARNFLAHKHNAIVNKHRQNALLTFNALVNAAGQPEARDIVLSYASACIFAPQETGYTKSGGGGADVPSNIIQTVPKLTSTAAS